MNTAICLRAFAKINLGLKVLAKRADGYHEIRTVYQTIGLHDRLEVCLHPRRKDIEVVCDDPAIPSGRGNLVYRACELWRHARKLCGGVRVEIQKRIPAGSGLGGGSSDATATLLGLERLTGDRLNPSARWGLAAQLGSDVPLFLQGGSVLGCGRGEEVYSLPDLPMRFCLVVFPGFTVSTTKAYQAVSSQLTKPGRALSIGSFGAWPQFPQWDWGPAENDFERVVFAWWPELAKVKRRLIQAGAETASLTGSGSALYAIFKSARHLGRTSKLIPEGWLSFQTRTLSRASYQRKLFVA